MIHRILKLALIISFIYLVSITPLIAQSLERPTFKTISSTHFTVHMQNGDLYVGRRILVEAERSFNQTQKALGIDLSDNWNRESRCDIYIYQTREAYHHYSGRPEWSNAAATFIPNKIIDSHQEAEGLAEDILPHEITHLIFRGAVGHENKEIPLWVDEGIALFQEKGKRGEFLTHILHERLEQGKIMNVSHLTQLSQGEMVTAWKSPEVAVSTFYAQSYSIVNFLIEEYGESHFISFVRELANGKTMDKALERSFGFNMNGLQRKWVDHIVTTA